MIYQEFTIENFKGINRVTVSMSKNDLVLLLGINESGKTTILRAIEAFSYLNDPPTSNRSTFYRSIRRKSETQTNKNSILTAKIQIEEPLVVKTVLENIEGALNTEQAQLIHAFINEINAKAELEISRVFPFKNGDPLSPYYEIRSDHPFTKHPLASIVAKALVKLCPYIIYFEDFKDRIPEKITTRKKSEVFNNDWYDIIDGLFYTTNPDFSISAFKKYYSPTNVREHDARTVLRRVNKMLNESFTKKWAALSGVKDIEETNLIYHAGKKYFEIEIADKQGTTYKVDERSKGALWYLSFLMKTEFRKKKLRKNSGKSIFLIDEPASNLHSTAQQNMIGDFMKLVEDTTVIYSTHSQYLISTTNIKSTYIVSKDDRSEVSCIKWSDYIKQSTPNVTYYQPLANALGLIPYDLQIPWSKAIITEGPSDRHVLDVMYKAIVGEIRDFVIYPGTSATELKTLISLNLGWGASFKVLLDGDIEGVKYQQKYIEEFKLTNETIVTLPTGKKIESLFSESDKRSLYELAFGEKKEINVTKNEFASIFALLHSHSEKIAKVSERLESVTIESFSSLFRDLNVNILTEVV